MSPETFKALLENPEGPTLDFKREPYRADEFGRADLVKDVLAMANTPRACRSYIVFGVKSYADGRKDLYGLSSAVDDAQYQSIIKDNVFPCPTFLYEPVTLDGKQFGVIIIEPERSGPYQAIRDIGKTRQHVIYWRRGSQNDPAKYDEQLRIWAWCSGRDAEPQPQQTPVNAWDRFLEACHHFEGERLFFLLIGRPKRPATDVLEGLFAAPWSFVFDFDPNGLEDGFASFGLAALRRSASVHQVALNDPAQPLNPRASYWYHAAGVAGREATLAKPNWLDWSKKYGRDMQSRMSFLAASRRSRPVTFVALYEGDENYIDSVFRSAVSDFGEAADYVVASPAASSMQRLQNLYGATLIDIPIDDIAAALNDRFSGLTDEQDFGFIPVKSGAPRRLDVEELRYLEEDLEVLTSKTGTAADSANDSCGTYLRGGATTWFSLGLHCDVDRELTKDITRIVAYDLDVDEARRRSTTRINLYHNPGAGGSTIARRIAWDLHTRVPCVVLRRARPVETIGRLESLFSKSDLPLLIIVEGADVLDEVADDLYNLARARQVAAVFLHVQRRFGSVPKRERTFWLDSTLSKQEATLFAHRLATDRPERRQHLIQRANMDKYERTPFLFGLEAYEGEFTGLQNHVAVRLSGISEDQRRVLIFLSIAYYYAQQSIDASAFGSLLNIDRRRAVDFDRVFSQQTIELLRQTGHNLWRPAHALVAREILRQLLSPPNTNDERLWRQSLSEWALAFAEFCRGADPIPSDDLLDLAARCFLERDERETLDGKASYTFAKLIEDIPIPESRLAVFQRLTELFPDVSHFWGHLGRFYSLELGDAANALQALETAIGIEPRDGVLHHMKGMALRAQLYVLLDSDPKGEHKELLGQAIDIATKAANAFEEAREHAPDDEHGYISHAQMLIRLLEYAARATNAPNVQSLVTSPRTHATLRESVDTIETLLDEARRLRDGEKPTPYVARCLVQLTALYGNYDRVLQGWDSLTTRRDIYQPPIRRQIVYAYLARGNRDWDTLPKREVERIAALLRANLHEERNDPRNIRLWLRAVRCLDPAPSVESVIEIIAYWKASSDELDAALYLYALNTLRALDGLALARDEVQLNLEECRKKSRLKPNRNRSIEWVGRGEGIKRLVHVSQLGTFDENGFWSESSRLERLPGTIVTISGPEAGQIEFANGLRAFFAPGRSGHVKGRDENRRVTFVLGFSYDGHRAWEVRNA